MMAGDGRRFDQWAVPGARELAIKMLQLDNDMGATIEAAAVVMVIAVINATIKFEERNGIKSAAFEINALLRHATAIAEHEGWELLEEIGVVSPDITH